MISYGRLKKTAGNLAITLFTINRLGIWLAATFSILSEFFILYFTVNKVRYTEIDWSTYMQQVRHYMKGELNYTRIRGDTGPVVYPAGFIKIYRLLYYWTNNGTDIKLAQYIFCAIYLINLLLVFRLYIRSRRIPPFVFLFVTFTSYRVHSIFVLRLFNDPIAMLFLYFALNFFIDQNWYIGCLFYSLAVSVKMNILLFAPALFFVLLINTGPAKSFWCILACATIQGIIAIDFLLYAPMAYISRAFQLNRVFLYKWTVNWRVLPESLFIDKRLHLGLLACHMVVLLVFCFIRIFRSQGGLTSLVQKTLGGIRTRVDTHDILFAFFGTNLIGMVFARSLHYQFYCWYYHSLPYLLFAPTYSPLIRDKNQSVNAVGMMKGYQTRVGSVQLRSVSLRLLILLGVEYCWNVYPATVLSSAMLNILHITILALIFRNNYQIPNKKE